MLRDHLLRGGLALWSMALLLFMVGKAEAAGSKHDPVEMLPERRKILGQVGRVAGVMCFELAHQPPGSFLRVFG